MIITGIYKITLKSDGRCYIGSALDIHSRWDLHLKDYVNQYISRAIRKYGPDAFEWEILEEIKIDKLLKREQHYLDTLRPFARLRRGFNIREKADSNLGIKLSEKTRKRMSKSSKGKPKSESHKAAMRKDWRGKRSPEYFEGLSERVRGDKNPSKRPEVAKKISESHMGLTWKDDKERVRKHSERMKRESIFCDSEFQKQNRERHLGSKRSDESKERMGAWQQRLYLITDPDGNGFEMWSKDLKQFCKENNLGYQNLQQCSKTGKKYKKWMCRTL